MVEIQRNENAVGASRERLMSESLSRYFVQMADSSDVNAWTNETLTRPIRSKQANSAKTCLVAVMCNLWLLW